MFTIDQANDEIQKRLEDFKCRCERLQSVGLPKARNLPESLAALRREMAADLAAILIIDSQRKYNRILHSITRPYHLEFKEFQDWLAFIGMEDKEKILGVAENVDQGGTWFEVVGKKDEQAQAKPLQRYTIVLFRLSIPEDTLPNNHRCVIALVYEDFRPLFVPEKTRLQVSVISAMLNCWFHAQDPKGMIEYGEPSENSVFNHWLDRMGTISKIILGQHSSKELPWNSDWLVARLKNHAKHWWAPEESQISIEKETKCLAEVFRIAKQWAGNPPSGCNRAKLIEVLTYWVWWSQAPKGRIVEILRRDRNKINNDKTLQIKAFLKEQKAYENELCEVLKEHFERLAQL